MGAGAFYYLPSDDLSYEMKFVMSPEIGAIEACGGLLGRVGLESQDGENNLTSNRTR